MKKHLIFILFLLLIRPAPVLPDSANNAVRIDFEGVWQSSKEVSSVFAKNNTAYIANSKDGLIVIDLSDPSDPVVVRQHMVESATRIIGNGSYLYVIIEGQWQSSQDKNDKIFIYDISEEPEELIGEYPHDAYKDLGDMAVCDNTLFVTTSDSLISIDIRNPRTPVKSGAFDLGMTNLAAPGIEIVDHIAYIAAGTQGLKILDVTDPVNIDVLSEYEVDMWLEKIRVNNNVAFITCWQRGLLAIDVRDPYSPVKMGDFSIEPPFSAIGFIVKDNFGYLSYINPDSWDAGIIALCLNDIGDLKKAGEYTGIEWGNDLFFGEDLLLCANRNNLTVLKPFPYRQVESGLQVVPTRLSISEGNTAKVSIVGGMPPFYAGSSDPFIATAFVDENPCVHINALSRGNVIITVTDSTGTQASIQLTVTQVEKVIIVAGSGPYDGNHLWPATLSCTQYAYKILQYQGFTDETIYYLATDTSIDVNGDGLFTEVDTNAVSDELKNAILHWASDARNVIIYMSGHGSDGHFRIDEHELIDTGQLNSWLDELEKAVPGHLVFIYDACQSGSFLKDLVSDANRDRVLIASASQDESAYFTSLGSLSFSSLFWGQIQNGGNLFDSFVIAKNAIQYTYHHQTPLLDDNGNGQPNEDGDGSVSSKIYIGNGVVSAGDIPVIGSVSPDVTLDGSASAVIYADQITASKEIDRVWMVLTPPGFHVQDPDSPVLDVLQVEMTHKNNRYECIYNGFDTPGVYQAAVFARDSDGMISLPRSISIIQKSAPCAINITGFEIFGTQAVSESLTFQVQAAGSCGSPLYYRFSFHPFYGTPEYDGTHWTSMTDNAYQTTNQCTYTFSQSGRYMVVVQVVENPDSPDRGEAITGFVLDISESECRPIISSSMISGEGKTGSPFFFSANISSTCSSPLRYRYSMHPYFGTDWYDGSSWTPMTEPEWISQPSIEYTFNQPGQYIVTIQASPENIDFSQEPSHAVSGWSIHITDF